MRVSQHRAGELADDIDRGLLAKHQIERRQSPAPRGARRRPRLRGRRERSLARGGDLRSSRPPCARDPSTGSGDARTAGASRRRATRNGAATGVRGRTASSRAPRVPRMPPAHPRRRRLSRAQASPHRRTGRRPRSRGPASPLGRWTSTVSATSSSVPRVPAPSSQRSEPSSGALRGVPVNKARSTCASGAGRNSSARGGSSRTASSASEARSSTVLRSDA